MKIYILGLALFLPLVAAAGEPTAMLCNSEGICRTVYVGPLPSLQQDVNLDPPKKVIRQRFFDKKAVFLTVVNVGVSIWATLELNECRKDHGIGPCTDGGYGPFKAREILRQGQTGGLTLISLKIKSIEDRNDDKHKFWWTFQAGNIGWNLGVILQNRAKHYGPKEID